MRITHLSWYSCLRVGKLSWTNGYSTWSQKRILLDQDTKARLVVKGFNHRKGVDFEIFFSPVVKMSSIWDVLRFAASLNLEVEQLDVKTAFMVVWRKFIWRSLRVSRSKGKSNLCANWRRVCLDSSRNRGNGIRNLILMVTVKLHLIIMCLYYTYKPLQIGSSTMSYKRERQRRDEEYASTIGSLMYTMVCTRSNIGHVVGVVGHFLSRWC